MTQNLEDFRARVLARGAELYRDLPWRQTRDPYAVWVSEVMLQQTQVTRVDGRWQRWLAHFPTVFDLAAASMADVLQEWQGLGYNRRALALQRAAKVICEMGGELPAEVEALIRLPGIGPATAAGIRAFAFDAPAVYLETNVRTVFLHELFPEEEGVADARIVPLVRETCPADATNPQDDPRTWYYALLDYGAYLKRTVNNPSRRSAGHSKQSRFEGSRRQKRAELVRILLEARERETSGMRFESICERLLFIETKAGRTEPSADEVRSILGELLGEGFCHIEGDLWTI